MKTKGSNPPNPNYRIINQKKIQSVFSYDENVNQVTGKAADTLSLISFAAK